MNCQLLDQRWLNISIDLVDLNEDKWSNACKWVWWMIHVLRLMKQMCFLNCGWDLSSPGRMTIGWPFWNWWCCPLSFQVFLMAELCKLLKTIHQIKSGHVFRLKFPGRNSQCHGFNLQGPSAMEPAGDVSKPPCEVVPLSLQRWLMFTHLASSISPWNKPY